jgi:hypothetical protein
MDIKKLFELDFDLSTFQHIGLIAPLTLAIAVAATVATGYIGKRFVEQKAAVEAQVQLTQVPVTQSELQQVAKKLQTLSPDLTIEVSGTSLLVQGKSGTYPLWSYALATVPGLDGKLVWNSRSICINSCGNGMSYIADITANRQELRKLAQ